MNNYKSNTTKLKLEYCQYSRRPPPKCPFLSISLLFSRSKHSAVITTTCVCNSDLHFNFVFKLY